jgi:hypothetical protein
LRIREDMRNHRVALINADVLAVKPVEYVTHGLRSILPSTLHCISK